MRGSMLVFFLVFLAGGAASVAAQPNLVEAQKLTPPGSPNNVWFGYSVAMSGSTLAVGTSGEQAVYVFVRTGGTWQLQQRLTPSDGPNSYYAWSLALTGDTLAVGGELAVYMYTRVASVWGEIQRIPSPPAALGFGNYGLSFDGLRLLVGAPYDDYANPGVRTGAAYLYSESGGTWALETRLTDPDGAHDHRFGHAAAISGDYAAVGSYRQPAGAADNGGRVHVFHRSPDGTWSRQTTLTGTQQNCAASGENCSFGIALALAGDVLLVGAPHEDVSQGAAYIFARSGETWAQIMRFSGDNDGNLGDSVATDGTFFVAGAPDSNEGPGGSQGAAHVFTYDGNPWRRQKLTASDAVTGDWLGFSVAAAGNYVAAGASASRTYDGSAYVFATPELSIIDLALTEGDSGSVDVQLDITLSPASDQPVSVDFSTSDDTATAGTDYLSAAGILNFATGETTKQVTVTVIGDVLFEPDETFFVSLVNPVNAVVSDDQATATITNDDPVPALSIGDVLVSEGDSGAVNADFAVGLSVPSGITVTVDYQTVDGTATASDDYTDASGTLTFLPGVAGQTITVSVNGDTEYDGGDETFFVDLTNPVSALITDGQGVCTITEDDPPPPPSVDFYTVTPCRVIDTRNPDGPLGGPALVAGADRIFPIAGVCDVPVTATAVSVNLTVTQPTAAGNLRLFAAGTPVPVASAINYVSGVTRGNNGIFPLNSNGEIAARCSPLGSTHFILDVNGYFE